MHLALPRRIGAIVLALALVAAPAAGESPAPPGTAADAGLDTLFGRLGAARDAATAADIERSIWSAWMMSGRPEVDALMARAVTAMGVGDYAAALEILDRLVELAPTYAEGWNKRATVLYLVGEHARSLADIERVLELEPRHFGAISGIALIRLAQGDMKAALAAYRRALAIHPFLRGALRNLPALERAVEGDPI